MRISGSYIGALSLLVSSIVSNAYASPAGDTSKLLVVIDEKTISKDDYSQFWSSLESALELLLPCPEVLAADSLAL